MLELRATVSMQKQFLLIFMSFMIWSQSNAQSLETVPDVDLEKYAGTWYEIASFPQRFQKGCHCTTATYTMTDKDYIIVENKCRKDSVNGKESSIKGKAFLTGPDKAKLKVQFFWPFKGKYWIIDLAGDYSYAVVGHPNRKYLWILSRKASMEDHVYQEIVSRIKAKQFDISKLEKTIQENCEN